MKNWNRMQNAAALGRGGGGGGGYFIDVRNMHDCYMKFDYVRISLTREKYWYEIRDVLVPILHGVKFTKCEIYGSTKPQPPDHQSDPVCEMYSSKTQHEIRAYFNQNFLTFFFLFLHKKLILCVLMKSTISILHLL